VTEATTGVTVTVNLVCLSEYTDGQLQTLATQTVTVSATGQSSALVTFALEAKNDEG
jgi:lysine/ornithine N-monooxygenase